MSEDRDRFWKYMEENNINYEESIYEVEGDLYKRTGRIINHCLMNGMEVLDIGNGGVINYNYKRLSRLVCADLEVSDRVKRKYKEQSNIKFVQADITNMHDILDNSFDAVIVQNVIHHLAESKYKNTVNNLNCAVNECLRVLKHDGKLIIMESTMKSWAYAMERVFYPIMMRLLSAIGFDQVFQYSKTALKNTLVKIVGGELIKYGNVSTGKYTIFVGRRIPTKLLPLTFSFFILEKR